MNRFFGCGVLMKYVLSLLQNQYDHNTCVDIYMIAHFQYIYNCTFLKRKQAQLINYKLQTFASFSVGIRSWTF